MKRRYLIYLIISLFLISGIIITASCSKQTITGITAQEAFDLIQENKGNPDFIIIDVRTPQEFSDGHLEDAINLNFNSDTFREELEKLDKDKTYLIYCRSGNRSASAAAIMQELGFREVYDMGGIIDWTAEGFPIVK